MKPYVASIFTPSGSIWKSYRLKHWHGKRVKWRGKYVKIVASRHDLHLNFVCWEILVNGNIRTLNDPNFP